MPKFWAEQLKTKNTEMKKEKSLTTETRNHRVEKNSFLPLWFLVSVVKNLSRLGALGVLGG